MSFTVKDSGKRVQFNSGARRDTEEGKPRIDLISPHMLKRLGAHLAKGAEKYGDRNWEKGIPRERCMSSMMRHAVQALAGETDEDHLSAVIFNAMAMIHFEEVSNGEPILDTDSKRGEVLSSIPEAAGYTN